MRESLKIISYIGRKLRKIFENKSLPSFFIFFERDGNLNSARVPIEHSAHIFTMRVTYNVILNRGDRTGSGPGPGPRNERNSWHERDIE